MTSLSQLAQLYRTAGISFLPIRVDGSKAPAIPQWRDLQKRFPRDAEIEKWLAEGHGLAAIGGRISGNLEVIDFDDPTVFKRWVILVRRHLRDDFLKRLIVVR